MNDIVNPFQEADKPAAKRVAKKAPVGKTDKPKRVAVGLRKRASADARPGFQRRWVNDTEDRLGMFAEGGYTPVLDDAGNPKTRRAGKGLVAHLMEIDKDIYDGDQQDKYDLWNKDNQERLTHREGPGYYNPKS